MVLAALLVVASPSLVGAASITVGGSCSLADAITAANTDAVAGGCAAGSGADVITLAGDVTLTADLPAITTDITINGASHTIDGASQHRAILVATSGVTLRLNSLVLANNAAPTTGDQQLRYGGAIRVVTAFGFTDPVEISLDSVTVRDSSASVGLGGGLYCGSQPAVEDRISPFVIATITNSVFKNNYATIGGAINVNSKCRMTVTRSAFLDNTSRSEGAAIDIDGNATSNESGAVQPASDHRSRAFLTMSNSTVAGNESQRRLGGGIHVRHHSTVRLDHLTITNNHGHSSFSGNRGGGIAASSGAQNIDLHVRNSIVYGNINGDCFLANTTLKTNSGNMIGTGHCGAGTNPVSGDPGLSAEPGGVIPFYGLRSGSRAVDAVACLAGVGVDQRGEPRPNPGSASSATPCDVGAIEFDRPTTVSLRASGPLVEGGAPVTVTATVDRPVAVDTGVHVRLGGTATFGGSMKETAALNAGALALLRRVAPNHRLLNLPPPTGSDYWTPGEGISVTHGVGQLTIPAGQTTVSFKITVLPDAVTDPGETVTVDAMLRGPDDPPNCVTGEGGTVCTVWAGRFYGEPAETLTLTIADRPATAGEQHNSPPTQNQQPQPQPQIPQPAEPQPQTGQPQPEPAGPQPESGEPEPSPNPVPQPEPEPQQGDPDPQPVTQPQQAQPVDPVERQPQLQTREPTAPGPVVELTLDAHPKRITVTWQAPTSGDTANNYIVHLKSVDGGKSKHRRINATKTTTTFRNLKPDTTYRVWVRATNDTGKGPRVAANIATPPKN